MDVRYTYIYLEGIILSEVSLKEKDKCCMISTICVIKQQQQKQQKEPIDTENRLVVASGRRQDGRNG